MRSSSMVSRTRVTRRSARRLRSRSLFSSRAKADERAAVVVAIAIERAVDGLLQAVFHRLGQQDDDDGGEEGDDPAVLGFAFDDPAARRAQDQHVDGDDRGDGGGVDQQALEDDLHVHQAVADDRRGERQRDEAQRNRRQLHRNRRIDAERERQRVAQRERDGAERGAPHDPPQLALGRHRPRPRQRAQQHGQRGAEEHRQVDVLEPVEQPDHAARNTAGRRSSGQSRARASRRAPRRAGRWPAASAPASRSSRARAAARGTRA